MLHVSCSSRSLLSTLELPVVLPMSDKMQDNFRTTLDFHFFFLMEAKSQLGPSRGSPPSTAICSRKKDSENEADSFCLGDGAGLAAEESGRGMETLLGNPTGVVSVSRM